MTRLRREGLDKRGDTVKFYAPLTPGTKAAGRLLGKVLNGLTNRELSHMVEIDKRPKGRARTFTTTRDMVKPESSGAPSGLARPL
jgi:hypothetical protein